MCLSIAEKRIVQASQDYLGYINAASCVIYVEITRLVFRNDRCTLKYIWRIVDRWWLLEPRGLRISAETIKIVSLLCLLQKYFEHYAQGHAGNSDSLEDIHFFGHPNIVPAHIIEQPSQGKQSKLNYKQKDFNDMKFLHLYFY
jgi:hypothetical protein